MEFRILGSFEVVGPTGPIDLRGAKRRGLLACLLVHAGQPLSTGRLVEELWGNSGSDAAARTVQTYVSQLRKLLRGESACLETRPGGCRLDINRGDVDADSTEPGAPQSLHQTRGGAGGFCCGLARSCAGGDERLGDVESDGDGLQHCGATA
jgi:DNA-binding SARP family transcriptional activator